MRKTLFFVLLGGLVIGPMQTSAAVLAGNPSNYRTLLTQLQPGDRLELAAGTYADGLTLTGVSGSAAAPIVITGPATGARAVFTPRSCCNTVQLDGNSYLEVRNLTLDGTGGVGVDAVNSRGIAHDIVIDRLEIINYSDDQATVGVSTKGPAWRWTISNNRIIGAGTGMYLGNSDGSMPFIAGVIEGNLIIDTIGYNIEIKHQLSRAGITGVPGGDSRTIIRRNVFSKANNASSGANARPNLLVGHFPLSGSGANDLYEIYGNFFYQNPVEALFQGEGNIALYDNLFVNHGGSAVNIEPHNDRPRTVTIFHNTVVARDTGIRVTGGASGFVQRSIANAVFAQTALSGSDQVANITASYDAAGSFLNAPTAAIGQLDLFPRPDKLTGAAIDLSPFSAFTDGSRDFDGRERTATFRGAYSAEGQNDGWMPSLTTPPSTAASPGAPGITFTADPASVALGGFATLAWSSTSSSSCSGSGGLPGWPGAKATMGSQSVGPFDAGATFTLACVGSAGTAERSVSVSILPRPTIELAANPATVAPGGRSLLTWSTSHAADCTAGGAWAGSKAVAGNEQTAALTQTSTFELGCTGPGGSATKSVTVNVLASVSDPSPSGSDSGGKGAFTWASLLSLLVILRRTATRPRHVGGRQPAKQRA